MPTNGCMSPTDRSPSASTSRMRIRAGCDGAPRNNSALTSETGRLTATSSARSGMRAPRLFSCHLIILQVCQMTGRTGPAGATVPPVHGHGSGFTPERAPSQTLGGRGPAKISIEGGEAAEARFAALLRDVHLDELSGPAPVRAQAVGGDGARAGRPGSPRPPAPARPGCSSRTGRRRRPARRSGARRAAARRAAAEPVAVERHACRPGRTRRAARPRPAGRSAPTVPAPART